MSVHPVAITVRELILCLSVHAVARTASGKENAGEEGVPREGMVSFFWLSLDNKS